jgi:hypothetical protein
VVPWARMTRPRTSTDLIRRIWKPGVDSLYPSSPSGSGLMLGIWGHYLAREQENGPVECHATSILGVATWQIARILHSEITWMYS